MDRTVDLNSKDDTRSYLLDGWEPTHDRSVAGSRLPAPPNAAGHRRAALEAWPVQPADSIAFDSDQINNKQKPRAPAQTVASSCSVLLSPGGRSPPLGARGQRRAIGVLGGCRHG